MRKRGCTWAEIGKTLNVSSKIVRSYLIRHGLYEPTKEARIQWDVQKAFELWRDGVSFKEVAAQVGTAEVNVRSAFMRRGWLDGSTSRLTWDIKEARRLRDEGLSLREIAARVGTFTENLRKAFARRGWLDGKTSLLSWDIEEARKLREQGLSWGAIGKRVGASSTHVCRAFKRRGWLKKEKTALLKWDADEALRLWREGLSFTEVAARVGTAEPNVRKAFMRRSWLDGSTSRLTWDIKEARRLWKEGLSLKEVAARVGTFAENLRKAFVRRGWLDNNLSHLTWDIEKARRLRKQGLSWSKVAERVGARRAHVWRAFKRRGWLEDETIALHDRPMNLDWNIQRARRLRDAGLTWDEIGVRVGTSGTNVRGAFLRRGWLEDGEISGRAKSTSPPWDIETARELREAGLSWDEIGAQVGTAGPNVREAFIRRGWRRDFVPPSHAESEKTSDSGKASEPDWDLEEARRLRKQGLSWQAVADRVGSNAQKVWWRFKQLGWLDDEEIARPRKPFGGNWDIEKARRLRKQGLSFREVAERVGANEHTVARAFKRRGLRREPLLQNRGKAEAASTPKAKESSGSRKEFGVTWDIEEARRLRKQGLSWKAVADRVGSDEQRVWRAFKRLGWKAEYNWREVKWDIEEARRLREGGLSWKEIGARMNTDARNVRKAFQRRGWLREEAASHPDEVSSGDE